MPSATTSPPPPAGGGIIDSVRSLLATWVAVLRTRVDIISTEFEEQREWLERILLLALSALFFLSMGFILLTLFIVVCFWDTHPLWVLGGFAAVYLGTGIALFAVFRGKVKSKPRLFATTAEELSKDHVYLQPRNP